MPYGVFVPLRKATRERLLTLARLDRRLARDQAAVILEEAIAAIPVSELEAKYLDRQRQWAEEWEGAEEGE